MSMSVSLNPAVSYPAGSAPRSVAVADLNGDGRPDLAVADYGGNTVSVLLGKGDGTFGAAASFAAGSVPESVAVADLNGDSRPDLAVADAYGGVSVLLGKGDGTFGAAASFAAGSGPRSVAVADLNGDGRPDLAVADVFDNTVSVLLGKGDGTFGAAASFAAGSQPASVAVADLNGDGRPDLAVADYYGGVSVLLGKGDGTFGAATSFAAGSGPASVAVADLNGDGRPDLAVADNDGSNSSTVSVLINATVVNTPPAIGGTAANQATTDNAAVKPFAAVTVTDPDAGQTETATIAYAAANGTLSDPNAAADHGTLGLGSYTVSGTAAQVQADLRGLVFTPTAHEVAPGQTVTTGFALSVSDGLATAADATTSVLATATNDPPTITGTKAGQPATGTTAVSPFAGVTIADPDVGVQDSLTITLTGAGGMLSGAGLIPTGTAGTYSLAAASPATLTSELDALVFAPAGGAPGTSGTTSFTLTAS